MRDKSNIIHIPREAAASGAMSIAAYQAARQKLRETYGDSREGAGDRWEQELAKLFHRSGWTQEQLAQQEQKTQVWVSYQLRFGRFLEIITTVIKSNIDLNSLSERRFRSFWERTERTDTDKRDDEMRRFHEVIEMMTQDKQETPAAITQETPAPLAPKPSSTPAEMKETVPIEDTKPNRKSSHQQVADKIIKKFVDEKWHSIDHIVITIKEPKDKVLDVLTRMMDAGAYDVKCYSKQVGPVFHYQMVHQKRLISSADIAQKLGPIVKGLLEQGDRHMATVSRPTVQYLAGLLKQLFDEWTK
jgi:hypothetical protein